MSNENVVMVTADTKDLLGMSPAAAEAILSNCQVQIELAPKGDVATLDVVNAGHCVVTSPSNFDQAQWERTQGIYAAGETVKITGNAKVFRP
ncbi:hypothetical protein [Pseudomonas reactans]|uniref:hypothetical protein n=1 Tax=Pseudomonas reactans TaxID=117680 RepID=UPI0015A34BEF|nr:hypothetical protein [Pseudomonas reactans]NWC89987.1 hypothetical protein [Pseudomonas reactans]